MPRVARHAPGGMVFHVLNRACGRARIFESPEDYDLFMHVLRASMQKVLIRLLAYCVMPNHWHLVLWPRHDGDLARFMHRMTGEHARRWHASRETTGNGHVYQARYKSFPIQSDGHFLTVCRYVERNALRANHAARAEDWPWGSLNEWVITKSPDRPTVLSRWPIERRDGWTAHVNAPLTPGELGAVRQSVTRGRPFGEPIWRSRIAQQLGLEATLQPRGRPSSQAAPGRSLVSSSPPPPGDDAPMHESTV